MNKEELENKQLLEGNLRPAASRYLTIYLGEPSTGTWEDHIDKLYDQHKRKHKDIAEFMRNTIACAVLLPTHDKINIDEPENILHKCSYWRQIDERDWFSDLKAVAKMDLKILEHRSKMLNLGVIEPIAYGLYTRQAFNWLMNRAEESGCINDSNREVIKQRMTNLIYAYGGVVICTVFDRTPDFVKKVLNWRTGYFFERLIYKVFTEEEMYKIKKRELEKANQKIVKSVRI